MHDKFWKWSHGNKAGYFLFCFILKIQTQNNKITRYISFITLEYVSQHKKKYLHLTGEFLKLIIRHFLYREILQHKMYNNNIYGYKLTNYLLKF